MPQGPVPSTVRFNPDELRWILANGQFTPELMNKMHPDDLKMAQKLFNEGDYHVDQAGNDTGPGETLLNNMAAHPKAALGLTAAAAVPVAAGVGPATLAGGLVSGGKLLGGLGLIELLSRVMGPSAGQMAATYYGLKGAGSAMRGAVGAAEEEAAATRALDQKYGGKTPYNPSIPQTPPDWRPPSRVPQAAVPPGVAQEVERRIFGPQGPEAATFGVKPPPYPPNVSTQESLQDLIDRVTGASRAGGSDYPLIFHGGEDGKVLRKSVEAAKRAGAGAKRRSPVPNDDQD